MKRPYRLFAGTSASWGMALIATYASVNAARLRGVALLSGVRRGGLPYFCATVEDGRTGGVVWRGLRAGHEVPGSFKALSGGTLDVEVVAYNTPMEVSK
jgi:hypothetical protein